VHTSAKVRLTSVAISVPLSVVGRSRNDVIVAMANWQYLLHATYCSVAQRSRMIPLSVSPISDEPGKQSLYPDGDLDQNLIIYSLAHCQHSLKISYKSVRLRKVGDRQTDIQIDKQRRLRNLLEGGKMLHLLGRAPTSSRGFAPGHHWGTSATPVPLLSRC